MDSEINRNKALVKYTVSYILNRESNPIDSSFDRLLNSVRVFAGLIAIGRAFHYRTAWTQKKWSRKFVE